MDDLLELKERVDEKIQTLAADEIHALEAKMAKLKPLANRRSSGKTGPRGKAKPKYCNPKTGDTWSGRGMTPVWLRELEDKGKSREDFAI